MMNLFRVGLIEWLSQFYTPTVLFVTMVIGLSSLFMDRVQLQSRGYKREATTSLVIGVLYLIGAPAAYLLLYFLD